MHGRGKLWYFRGDQWALGEPPLFLLAGNLRKSCGIMLVGTLQLRSALRKMVNKVTRHSALQRELMEECLVYLAKLEAAAPDREEGWYLLRCGRHLTRFRYLARSWEGPKLPPALVAKAPAFLRKKVRTAEEIHWFSKLIEVLSKHLSRRESKVLTALAEGYALEAIANSLNQDLSEVLRAQCKIAALILKLGLAPKPDRPRKKARGMVAEGKVQSAWTKSAEIEASAGMMPAMRQQSDLSRDEARPS